jgi:hypothetical protein
MTTRSSIERLADDAPVPHHDSWPARQPPSVATISQSRLKELLHYDPETGVFTWRVAAANCIQAGDIAGSPNGDGYRQIKIGGRPYLAHRLAFLFITGEWPPGEIDHKNADRTDNRWANLRAATRSQNMANGRKLAANTSGFKGVYWCQRERRWMAAIGVDGKRIYIGRFDTPESAHVAYAAAAIKYYGQFARVS